MDDCEEIDILGDFDYKTSSSLTNPEDDAELPSKSVQLLPEFSQHPWLLEQGWTLDHCTDEKSRAAIEKMLIEEQSYTDGKVSKSSLVQSSEQQAQSSKPQPKVDTTTKRKSSWTDEERTLFFQGFEIYGRRWSKIAELIPGKTRQQVKNFALHHLKKVLGQSSSDTKSSASKSESHRVVIDQPSHSLPVGSSLLQPKQPLVKKVLGTKTETKPDIPPVTEVIRIKRQSSSDTEDEEIDIEVDSEEENTSALIPNVQDISNSAELCASTVSGSYGTDLCDPEEVLRSSVTNSWTDNVDTILDKTDESFTSQNEKSELEKLAPSNTFATEISENDPCTLSESANVIGNELHDSCISTRTCSDENDETLDDIQDNNISSDAHGKECTSDESYSQEENEHPNEFGLVKSDGTLVYLPNPTSAVTIDRDVVTDLEQDIHEEFFDGRPGIKTADRYMKIRNHILECWEKCKPSYLNKTSVRTGLRNCGDVNCIGRIHSYLEQIGGINFGLEQAQYNQPVSRPQPRILKELPPKETIAVARVESMRPRKRRVKDAFGDWIDERDLEGKTIEHGLHKDIVNYAMKSKSKPPPSSSKKNAYDPFKLIPCSHYGNDKQAPFSVSIEASALVVMDAHSHLSKTEVIGLLGGHYDRETQRLVVMTAEPCDSTSTGMQCDMDPVSQTEASERLVALGQKVVGWYHSHPVFEANPSLRDIETQLDFQEWFSVDGGAFVGIIISPFDRNSQSVFSDIRCLCVEKTPNDNQDQEYKVSGQPYQFEYTVSQRKFDMDNLLLKLREMAQKYVGYINRVQLLEPYKSNGVVSCLDKMVFSIENSFKKIHDASEHQPENLDIIKDTIKTLFEELYKGAEEKKQYCVIETDSDPLLFDNTQDIT